MIWEDSARSSSLDLPVIQIKPGRYKIQETLVARGKIRIKLGGFDNIRSRNKNNVFAFGVKMSNNTLYRNQFLYVPYSQSSNRHIYYDTNRSSLTPPVYFYNLYDLTKNESLDLTDFSIGEKLEVIAYLEDASGNQSELLIPITIGNIIENQLSTKPNNHLGTLYQSNDKRIQLDFRKNETFGTGYPILQSTHWKDEGIKIPKGLEEIEPPYKITVQNFNWKGEVEGFLKMNSKPSVKETLYFYDTSIKRFSSIWSQRTTEGFRFKTAKLGTIGVLSDNSPPYVYYAFSFSKNINLPLAENPKLLSRTYYLGDSGSGYTTNPEVYLEGEKYPFEYDRDRHAIHLSFPKKAFSEKKYLLLEIRPKDWAGNIGKPFTELLTLDK